MPRSLRRRLHRIDGPYLNRAPLRARNTRCDAESVIEIRRLDQVVACQLFGGLGKRTVGKQRFAIAYADRGRGRSGLQAVTAEEVFRLLYFVGEISVGFRSSCELGRSRVWCGRFVRVDQE